MPNPNVIIVGVVDGQPRIVLEQAVEFARRFDAMLLCASVDPSRYLVERFSDGLFTSMPIDPEIQDLRVEKFDEHLRKQIATVLEPAGVPWSVHPLVGDPSSELIALADRVDAILLVVGTRSPGFRGTLQEFFNGSVAAHLAHRQHRPVIVIPHPASSASKPLPWEGSE
ncbi:nucleotide-binding universal stress UspA family protein [Mycetocola sp. CAN_C7]|uniref:universal stress protein n=1 Tax=Mycetocola sp. CAN_C7 TaxID=2787724 RepID=UPI0018CB092E